MPSDTAALAGYLLGTLLVADVGRVVVRIVETEAYVPGDAASHAFRGETSRNHSMFLRRGHAYVYLIYGTSYCLNVSSESAGIGAAVLIRAAEPILGRDVMEARRNGARPELLCRGPGRLARALGIDRRYDGLDLCRPGPLWLARGRPPGTVGTSVRIGLTKEASRVLRFFEVANPSLSGPRKLNAADGAAP